MPVFNQNKLKKLAVVNAVVRRLYLFPKNKKVLPPLKQVTVQNILVIGFLLIGDTILYLPALRVLKNNFPAARITIVCDSAVKTILEDLGIIDHYIIVKCPWISPFDKSKRNILNFFGAIKNINVIIYDVAIDFRGDWRNIFYMNFIKAKRKVSYNFSGGEYMLTDPIAANEKIVHYTAEALYLLKQIGCTYTDQEKLPSLRLSADKLKYVQGFKSRHNLNGSLLIGIHPGTTQEVKRWDERKYSELLIRISKLHPKSKFIIYEGPNERDTVAQIEAELTNQGVEYILVRKKLEDYIILISICDIVICNDSGAAHIASAFAVPTVVIFGNVDPKHVIPYGAEIRKIISHNLECKPCYQSFCKFGHNLCIKEVTVDEVYNGVSDIIDYYAIK